MNSINLPIAAAPQSAGTATASTGLPLDLAMLDSAVPEELFAALLAGQLQALTAVTDEYAGLAPAAPEFPVDELGQDAGALLAAGLPQAPGGPALAMLASAERLPGLSGLGSDAGMDQGAELRQALAAPAAAFAMPALPAAAASAASLTRQVKDVALPAAALDISVASTPLKLSGSELADLYQPQGTMTFALPQLSQTVPLNASAASPLAQTVIPQQVGSQAWGGMVGERVVWMFGQQHQSAEIMLNPPSLGPLEVRLSMSDGQANLTFTTQHAPVREALEAATPRLREMLSESGIGLGNVSVNVGNFSRQDPQPQQQADNTRPAAWSESSSGQDLSVLATDLPSRKGSGLLDLFA